MVALDLNGKFIINVVENYVDKDIIFRFIRLMEMYGVYVEELERFEYVRVD